MPQEPLELYRDKNHACLMFSDLVEEDGQAVQANQFLIVDDDTGAIIDPGGNLAFNELFIGMTRHFPPHKLSYLIASHADPDIIASLNKWMVATHCKVLISRLWTRFVPHFTTGKDYTQRIVGIPDAGMNIPLGDSRIKALPAHFMHSEGNFQFYDPVAKILFSGDMGASMVDDASPVQDFAAHVPSMAGFHRRYMASNKACRFWAQMVREMDVAMIVPQHGRPFVGPQMINAFLDWIEQLECGLDLMTQQDYRLPD